LDNKASDLGLGPINEAFPNATFPLGAVHEFIYQELEDAAATRGFLSGLLASITGSDGIGIWISNQRKLFPPALKSFGVAPDRFLFIDLHKERDLQWVMEEALKCPALTAVVAEMNEISFKASRRLQLAVEQSKVTGFILHFNTKQLNTTACVSRWRVKSLPSEAIDELPGIGFPKWHVELLRIRNGRPGAWDIQWKKGMFVHIAASQRPASRDHYLEKVG
jgi:protein ImuA